MHLRRQPASQKKRKLNKGKCLVFESSSSLRYKSYEVLRGQLSRRNSIWRIEKTKVLCLKGHRNISIENFASNVAEVYPLLPRCFCGFFLNSWLLKLMRALIETRYLRVYQSRSEAYTFDWCWGERQIKLREGSAQCTTWRSVQIWRIAPLRRESHPENGTSFLVRTNCCDIFALGNRLNKPNENVKELWITFSLFSSIF